MGNESVMRSRGEEEEQLPCLFKLGKNALGFSASRRRGREKMETLTRLTFGASLPPLNGRLSKMGVCAITKKAMGGRSSGQSTRQMSEIVLLVVAMNEIWCINKSLLIAGEPGEGAAGAPTWMGIYCHPSVSRLTPLPPPAGSLE